MICLLNLRRKGYFPAQKPSHLFMLYILKDLLRKFRVFMLCVGYSGVLSSCGHHFYTINLNIIIGHN